MRTGTPKKSGILARLLYRILPGLLLPYLLLAADDAPTIIFGGSVSYPPHHFLGSQGMADGFDIELLREIADRNGWELEFRFDDWAVIQEELAAGRIDVVPMFVSESRRDRSLFSDPVLIENHFLYGNPAAPGLRSLGELAGQTIAAEIEAYALQELRAMGASAVLVETNSEGDALEAAARGEVDYAVSPGYSAEYVISRENLAVVRQSPPLFPVEYAFAVNRDRPELVTAINDTLIALSREGFMDNLADRWLDEASAASSRQMRWTIVSLAVIALLFFAGLYRYRLRLQRIRERLVTKNRQLRAAKRREIAYTRTDQMTGLYTRNHFLEQCTRALPAAKEKGCGLAVAVLKYRNFDQIQMSQNYSCWDALIKQMAENLHGLEEGLAGYFGQGVFSLLFEKIDNGESAEERIARLLHSLNIEYSGGGMLFTPEIAAGVVVYSQGEDDAYELLRKAHLALKAAEDGNERLVIYESGLDSDSTEAELMLDLQHALANGGLSWAYQPQVNIRTRAIESAEMLIRWNHPVHGWIPPNDFIARAEQAGLINRVTQAVARRALETLAEWQQRKSDCQLSINISANDLADRENVDFLVDKLGVLGGRLTLEITETAIMKDFDSIISNVERLRERDVKLSLDDYGTGYSSLEYLKRFQFDELKIDKLFISQIAQSERDMKLTQASINLGHDLGAVVVAEGVEDKATADILIEMQCDVLQGYGISRPVPIEEFNRFREEFLYDFR